MGVTMYNSLISVQNIIVFLLTLMVGLYSNGRNSISFKDVQYSFVPYQINGHLVCDKNSTLIDTKSCNSTY